MNRRRILCIPSILFISSSKSINLKLFSLKSLPYEAKCIPVITTSFIPVLAILVISLTTFSGFLLLICPLANGIIQYEQNLSHPSCTFITALVFSVNVTSPKSAYSSQCKTSVTSTLFTCSLFLSVFFSLSFTKLYMIVFRLSLNLSFYYVFLLLLCHNYLLSLAFLVICLQYYLHHIYVLLLLLNLL